MKKQVFLRHPKWRYGGYAVLITAAVIAVMALVNVGIGQLEERYGWRTDFSFNNLTTQSETTRNVLKSLPFPVHIYALYTKGQEDLTLMEILNRYQAGSSVVTYEMLELDKNPGLISRFQGDSETSLSADSLIVYCEKTNRYKILPPESFSSLGYNIESGDYGLEAAYEKRITESLLYVTRDTIPEIMLLSGHGELSGEGVTTLTQALSSNNYQVRSVDLHSGDKLTPGALLMILSPRIDLDEEELTAITGFAEAGGSLFITCEFNNDLSNMPRYMSLLRLYGIVPRDGVVVASSEEADTFFNGNTIYLTPHLLSSAATDSLLAAGFNYFIMPGARAFETPMADVSGLTVTPVLASGYKAYLRDISDGNTSPDQLDTDPIGPFSLALLSTRTQQDGTLSNVFAIGNSMMLTDGQLYTFSYNLEFLLRMCEHLLNQKPISLDIIAKPYMRPGLMDASKTAGAAVAVALPLMVLILALAVLLPRRHR